MMMATIVNIETLVFFNISSLYQRISSLDHKSSSLEDEISSVSLNAIHSSHIGRPVGHRSGEFIGDSLLILSHCNILADEGTILVKSTVSHPVGVVSHALVVGLPM